ncbi:LysR family transcriptional regulator [Sorangium sp. So ce726]|uniref:LysR family transcriptional regulator n=1 Tax=Sorangium sp. So ce726 TaxID=3133319 RepID=UPI003F6279A4
MDLDELRVFVAIVDRGSFAAAAKALRFPLATLRRRFDELEARMGVKLLDRSHQGAVPTGAGAVLVDKARGLLHDVQSLAESVRQAGAEPSGELRIAIPQGMLPEIASAFFHLALNHTPKVTWRIHSVDDPALAFSGEVHAAICFGAKPPDGPWVARKLLTLRERLVASPAYLEQHGTPSQVDDLAAHRLLLWERPGDPGDTLPLADGTRLPIAPSLRMTDPFLLQQCAARGCGIAFLPEVAVPVASLEGGLVPVLEDQVQSKIYAWALARPSSFESPKIRSAFEEVVKLLEALRQA